MAGCPYRQSTCHSRGISRRARSRGVEAIAPVEEIGRIAREHEALSHTDATQAVGHIPVDAEVMNIDLLSLSAHKTYGPKGIGTLYVRKRRPRVRLAQQVHGGGHERGMRSGTSNVPAIVGLGKALEIAEREMETEAERLRKLRDRLWAGLQSEIDNVRLNGHPTQCLPHNLSVAIPGVESRSLLVQLKHDVALSTGSACTTAKVEPSHVILALGYDEERAHCSLRFGLGRENTEADVDFVVERIAEAVKSLQQLLA